MKQTLLAIILLTMGMNSYSENATYDTETKIILIPFVDYDGAPVLSDVELKLRNDGLLHAVGYEMYTPPATKDCAGRACSSSNETDKLKQSRYWGSNEDNTTDTSYGAYGYGYGYSYGYGYGTTPYGEGYSSTYGYNTLNATYNADAKTVNIPIIEVEGVSVLSDTLLRLRDDGLFQAVSYKLYESATTENDIPSVPEPYSTVCFACHDQGIAGAPKLGDNAQWSPRIAKGLDALVVSVITNKGVMGGFGAIYSEVQIREVVEYMISVSN